MKIVFAGTPDLARNILERILAAGFQVDLVLTQPDRAANRGLKKLPSPVKELALNNGIPVLQPESLRNNPQLIEHIKQLAPDVIIVVAYGLILPQEFLNLAQIACVNIHVSLLPRWRGAAPIQRAIESGDTTTGVTLMLMDRHLDTGPIISQESIPIEATDSAQELENKLSILGSWMILMYLQDPERYPLYPQGDSGITYANKIDKVEAQIDWSMEATNIARKILAFNPKPGCATYLINANNENLFIKIWRAEPVIAEKTKLAPGSIMVNDNQLWVACGNCSILHINELQIASKRRQSANQFLLNFQDIANWRFIQLLPQ